MTRTSRTARRSTAPGALLVALALAASASVGVLPVGAAGPLDRVVVTGADAAAAVGAAGGRVLQRLPLVGGVGALLPSGAVLPRSVQVSPDRALSVQGTRGSADGTAASVRSVLGLGAPAGEGAGVTVAVVDTGVAAGLADLPDSRVEHVAVVGRAGTDRFGHGTFVAGLVAGSGGASGTYAGVAPAAHILDVKVADDDGSTSLLAVLQGLQAVADHGHVDVLNLSLSSESPLPYGVDPLTVALDELWRRGTTVVVPSGNDASTVSSPGSDPTLLTLGGLADNGTAGRDDDTLAAWSGRGRSKPDLVAPGASVVSLLSPGSGAASGQVNPSPAPGYGMGSGTSFATAVASGAAAAVLAARPGLTPDEVKALLTGTAYRSKGLKDGTGAGGLDLASALTAKASKAKDGSDGKDGKDGGTLPAADLDAWQAFVAAVLDTDPAAAQAAWDHLSPQARTWAARTWADLTPEARTWAARTWAARTWAGSADGEDTWAARTWAARTWAARTWAAGDWSARTWSARTWSARTWSTDAGPDGTWSARTWSARTWSGRTWS